MKLKSPHQYDLAVIGSGSAGSAGAIAAASAGLKVAVIEADKWGGNALNYEDVPFAALFHASHLLGQAVTGAKFGISSSQLRYNYPTMNNWKNIAMRRAGAGSKKTLEDAGVTCISGRAHFIGPHEISVGEQRLSARHFLIATGADMLDTGITIPPNLNYLTPNTITSLIRPPRTLFVVGAGSTGCELAQFYAELGTKVLIADIAGRLLPREDEEVGQVFDEIFNRLGIKVLTQSRVVALQRDLVGKKVIFMRGGQEKSVHVDEILLATGTTPATDLGLENAGVKYNSHGIKVDKSLATTSRHIFAGGDCIDTNNSSTEKSILEAGIAVSHIVNNRSKNLVDYTGITRSTRTWPEIASVGITEDDCLRHDRKIQKVVLPLSAVQASNTSDFHDGFVKIITDRQRKIIGATLVAPHATDMIAELALAIRFQMTPHDLAGLPHVASSWSELIRIACQKFK